MATRPAPFPTVEEIQTAIDHLTEYRKLCVNWARYRKGGGRVHMGYGDEDHFNTQAEKFSHDIRVLQGLLRDKTET